MSITITRAGVCDTIQDKGRAGYGAYGINPGGAMDRLAFQCSNAIAANDLNEAVIEMHFPAASILFNQTVIIGISGADFSPSVQLPGGIIKTLPVNKTILIPGGSILSFPNKTNGERCYLSVMGGFSIPGWLGSTSTNLKIHEGGYKGRMLKSGDTIGLNQKPLRDASFKIFPWLANFYTWYFDSNTYNIIEGPEWDWLDKDSQKKFSRNPFITGTHSDRMGISLEGPSLTQSKNEQLLSSAVVFGTIQLLPSGQIIILAADHPTTGGYPRIATIIQAHFPKLAQVPPGSKLRFLYTSMDNAIDMILLQQKELKQMQQAVKLQLPAM